MYLEFIFTTFNWFNICVSFPSASSHFFWLPNWQQSSQILNIRIKKLELYTVVLMVSNYLCHHCLQSNWKEKDHYTEPTLTLACSPWLAILNGNKKGIRSSVDHNVSSNFEQIKEKVIISLIIRKNCIIFLREYSKLKKDRWKIDGGVVTPLTAFFWGCNIIPKEIIIIFLQIIVVP